ncbi:hypothetical protein [Pantoea vagans]|uniref:hypothetical protein n=1 Tax=Pantoea vagans TaxID=470934 RepID=UPI00366BE82F
MNKLTAEVARQDLSHLKSWVETCGISTKEERYMQALEIALPILEKQERGEGEWIEWAGGECPVFDYAVVAVRFRNYSEEEEYAGGLWWGRYPSRETDADIIAYRIIPERATNQNGEQ